MNERELQYYKASAFHFVGHELIGHDNELLSLITEFEKVKSNPKKGMKVKISTIDSSNSNWYKYDLPLFLQYFSFIIRKLGIASVVYPRIRSSIMGPGNPHKLSLDYNQLMLYIFSLYNNTDYLWEHPDDRLGSIGWHTIVKEKGRGHLVIILDNYHFGTEYLDIGRIPSRLEKDIFPLTDSGISCILTEKEEREEYREIWNQMDKTIVLQPYTYKQFSYKFKKKARSILNEEELPEDMLDKIIKEGNIDGFVGGGNTLDEIFLRIKKFIVVYPEEIITKELLALIINLPVMDEELYDVIKNGGYARTRDLTFDLKKYSIY